MTAADLAARDAGIAPRRDPQRVRTDLLLNVAHFLDHFFLLIFPTAVLAISREWGTDYGTLLPLATAGFLLFGAGSLPAGWIADHWSRHGTIVVFFIGIGLSSIATGLAQGPIGLGTGLTLIGLFAAIYHPVGIAMLVKDAPRLGRTLGINGVWGNFGLGFAALVTGALVDLVHWRAAFVLPGLLSIALGAYFWRLWPAQDRDGASRARARAQEEAVRPAARGSRVDGHMWRVFVILAVTAALNALIFNSTTIAMPKVFDARLQALTQTTLGIGVLVCLTYCLAAMAQLVVGTLIDRVPLKSIFVPIVALQVPLLYAASRLDNLPLLLVAVAMMFSVFGQIPLNDAIVTRYTAERWRARAFAVRYVISFTGASAAVWVVAVTVGAGGYGQLFVTLASSAAVVLVAALFFPSGRAPART